MAYETTDQLIAEISDHWVKDPRGNMYKLLDTYNTGFEQISDMANKVEKWRAIKDAEGATLDLFGQDLSTSRPTKEDDPYRFLLRLKVLLSRAQGTIPSIFKITSTALGTTQGIKIWKTGPPRHIAIQIPWDYVSELPVEKFLLENLQHMLALGYWLDYIVFRADTPLKLYIGVGTQDRWQTTARSKTIWWTGWKAKTNNQIYAGIVGRMSNTSIWKAKSTIWWSGWKANTTPDYYVGMAQRFITSSIWSTAIN